MSENVYESPGCVVTHFSGPEWSPRLVQINFVDRYGDFQYCEAQRTDFYRMVHDLAKRFDENGHPA